jgi:hypothetical protein
MILDMCFLKVLPVFQYASYFNTLNIFKVKKNKINTNDEIVNLGTNILNPKNSSIGCDTIEDFQNQTSFLPYLAVIEISLIINNTLKTENNVSTKQLTLKFEEICLGTFIDEYTIVSSRLCVRIDDNSTGIMGHLNKLPPFLKQFEYNLATSRYFYTAYYGISSHKGNQAGSILRGMPFKSIFIVILCKFINFLFLPFYHS